MQPLEAVVGQVVVEGQVHDHREEEVAVVLHEVVEVVEVAPQLKEVVEEVGLHGLEEEVEMGRHDLEEEVVEVGLLEWEEVAEVGLLAWEEEVVEAGLQLHVLEEVVVEVVAMENHVEAGVAEEHEMEEVGVVEEHHDERVAVVVEQEVEVEVESHD